MSDKPTTHVLMVVDMSGSMAGQETDVRGGFNTFVQDLLKDRSRRYRITATVFDTAFEPLCIAAKLKDVPLMTEENYRPRGTTALFDAVGKTIHDFERQTKLDKDDKVLLVTQTDGAENSSILFNAGQIAEMIRVREEGGKWSTLYLGAGKEAWGQGHQMGFRHNYSSDNSGVGTRTRYAGSKAVTVSFAKGEGDEGIAVAAASVGLDEDTGTE